jgi:hypothetical protein
MTIAFQCSSCQHPLRVPDDVAGKRLKCPQCQEILRIPAPDPSAAPGNSPQAATSARSLWQLKTRDASTYGPVPKSELDQWLAEGRITGECQLLEGQGQWQWATEVYPQLAMAAAAPPPPPAAETVTPSASPTAPASPQPALPPAAPLSPDPAAVYARASWPVQPARPFRSRSYPAMQLTSRFYLALGWIVIFVAAVAGFMAVVTIGGIAAGSDLEGPALAFFLGKSLLVLTAAALATAALVITLWFAAEAIKCLMDIQENTHRAAFHQEQHNPRDEF